MDRDCFMATLKKDRKASAYIQSRARLVIEPKTEEVFT